MLQVAQLQTIQSLKEQVEQSQKLADMYREQCIGLEDELGRIKEETDVGRELFKERNDKVSKRLTLMNQRYAALEKRRALEVEGFKNDIKMLRNKLKNVEKHLFKVKYRSSREAYVMLYTINEKAFISGVYNTDKCVEAEFE